jgi:hypothetical protein
LAKQYHPDRVDALPLQIRELVVAKMAAINQAHEFSTKGPTQGVLCFQSRAVHTYRRRLL